MLSDSLAVRTQRVRQMEEFRSVPIQRRVWTLVIDVFFMCCCLCRYCNLTSTAGKKMKRGTFTFHLGLRLLLIPLSFQPIRMSVHCVFSNNQRAHVLETSILLEMATFCSSCWPAVTYPMKPEIICFSQNQPLLSWISRCT